MRPRLFTLAAGASAVLCVTTCVLWVRSDRATHEYSWLRRQDCYRLESRQGRLTLFAPPPATTSPGVAAAVDAAVAELRNDQVHWYYLVEPGHAVPWASPDVRGFWINELTIVRLHFLAPAGRLVSGGYRLSDLARPLLAAMDDPDRFAAAHLALSLVASGKAEGEWRIVRRTVPGEPLPRVGVLGEYDGLFAHVPIDELRTRDDYLPDGEPVEYDTQLVPGQLPTLRAAWHRRLDVPVVVVAYWQLSAATLLLPGGWCSAIAVRRVRARTRRERRRCVLCGYDLRATPGRCPECGTVATR